MVVRCEDHHCGYRKQARSDQETSNTAYASELQQLWGDSLFTIMSGNIMNDIYIHMSTVPNTKTVWTDWYRYVVVYGTKVIAFGVSLHSLH